MAERRMFAKSIIDSDAFLEMPQSSQNLYFHFGMRADDDGFINNPKKIQRMVGCSDDDLKLLIAKSFIIPFDSGIVVIKHWKIHNYIQKDRYKPTNYLEEKAMLFEKENKSYTLENPMYTKCIQNVYKMDTQVRLGKNSKELDKVSSKKEEKKLLQCNHDVTQEIEKDKDIEIDNISLPELYQKYCANLEPYREENYSDEITMLAKSIHSGALALDDVVECFKKANKSKFLQGKKTNFKADFRWLINVKNIQKVLSGKYDDKQSFEQRDYDFDDLERKMLLKRMEKDKERKKK